MGELQSIKTSLFRKFLLSQGLVHARTRGDHEVWSKPGMTRPVIIQAKNKNVPAAHIRTNLKTLGLSVPEFLEIMKEIK